MFKSNVSFFRFSTDAPTSSPETKKEEKVNRGLQVRVFDYDLTDKEKKDDKGKALKIGSYKASKICLPWNRTGKDTDGKEVSGAVPSMAEVIAYSQSLGYSIEIELTSDGNPSKDSIVAAICDGLNRTEAMKAKSAAENTPESAITKAINSFAKNMGISAEAAEKQLFPNGRPF